VDDGIQKLLVTLQSTMGEEGRDLTAATLHNLSIKRALTVSYHREKCLVFVTLYVHPLGSWSGDYLSQYGSQLQNHSSAALREVHRQYLLLPKIKVSP